MTSTSTSSADAASSEVQPETADGLVMRDEQRELIAELVHHAEDVARELTFNGFLLFGPISCEG